MTEILYIEDNEFDRLSFKEAMSIFKDMSVSYATNIREALELINNHAFKLIICDFQLPDGTAYDILDLKCEFPVIVMTGQGDEKTAIKSIQKGAKDYIFKDFNGKHLNILPVIIEKTLRLAEAELAQARLAAIVESAGDAIITVDLDQKIVTWNHGAEEIYGYTNIEAIGFDCSMICNGTSEPLTGLLKYVKKTHETVVGEFSHRTKKNNAIDVYMSLSPVWDSTGKINCISMISKNITEFKLRQKLLARKEDELQRSKEVDARKDEFISIASHELKTPLTTLKAYVQLLEKQARSFKQLDKENFISAIEKTSNHIQKLEVLINDLFSISRIQSGKLLYQFTPFNFDKMVEGVVESLQECNSGKKLRLMGRTNMIVQGDSIRLEEVITNYLTNAMKFSPKDKHIEIILTNNDDEVSVCVKDYGPGISENDLEHIFKRYYRSKENSYKFQGLGIGLYISKEIVSRHHGRSWVFSKHGHGAEFYFTIPVNQASAK